MVIRTVAGPVRSIRPRLGVIRGWSARRWTVAVLGALASALALGIPTGIVRTPFYTRMTPVLWWNYPVLAASAALLGLTLATYVQAPVRQGESTQGESTAKAATGGGVLSLFAVGCPICNKLVVFALGVSGALRYFAPLQPLLGVASLLVIAAGLWVRLGGQLACPVTSSP